MSRVIFLDGSSLPDREIIGGKAWSVARMRSLGLRVPPAFVIPVDECRRGHWTETRRCQLPIARFRAFRCCSEHAGHDGHGAQPWHHR